LLQSFRRKTGEKDLPVAPWRRMMLMAGYACREIFICGKVESPEAKNTSSTVVPAIL
jgi:hypothetical protein